MDQAVAIAGQYLSSTNITGLALDEGEEWKYNYYLVVKESFPSEYKAFQLIVDKYTGVAMPEPGPNMMWNTKYGRMMNGMGGRLPRNSNNTMSITPLDAVTAANDFLAARFSPRRLAVVSTPDLFYGYYNFDVNDVATGSKYGMLSVHGTTGQVWYHTWHGNFIQGREIE